MRALESVTCGLRGTTPYCWGGTALATGGPSTSPVGWSSPEVITLSHYDRLPNTAVTFSRRNVAKRDHYICQYCGAQPGAESITIDHVQPRSQGGTSTWTNCVAACEHCNAKKGDRTPDQAGMRLRRRPVRPEWKPFYATQGARIESWARFMAHEPALAMA